MNDSALDSVAKALLYEGYVLYPYRPSSVKNRQRWTLGGIFPADHVAARGAPEKCWAQTQVLVEGEGDLSIDVRFLHLVDRTTGDSPEAWQEAVERKVSSGPLSLAALSEKPFRGRIDFEPSLEVTGEVQRRQEGLSGWFEARARRLNDSCVMLTVRVENATVAGGGGRPEELLRTFTSCHLALRAEGPRFVSPVDPPKALEAASGACENVGLWPVLIGKAGSRDVVLASPIILYDYPQVAAESPGDLFDGTEIDEILSLRILTLTDEEKRAAAAADDRVRVLLERTEALGNDELAMLHGAIRERKLSADAVLHAPRPSTAFWERDGVKKELRAGSKVVLHPKRRADIFDLALAGQLATISSVEQNFEGEYQLSVTVDADPGRDLGATGIPGHRFFFMLDEVEPQ